MTITGNDEGNLTKGFAGLRVFDFSTTIAGPHCARMLADMGAEVIKIETAEGETMRTRPPLRNGCSTTFGQLNVGKHSRAMWAGDRGRKIEHTQSCKTLCQIALIVSGYCHSVRIPCPKLLWGETLDCAGTAGKRFPAIGLPLPCFWIACLWIACPCVAWLWISCL